MSNTTDTFELSADALAEIERIIPRYPEIRSALLPILHVVQKEKGFISLAAMEWIADRLEIEAIAVKGVVSFYPFFREMPIGKHLIRLCRTLSCALCGGMTMADILEKEFGCKMGETSPDGLVTLEFAECLASCGSGPVMLVDEELHEHLDEEKIHMIAQDLRDAESVQDAKE